MAQNKFVDWTKRRILMLWERPENGRLSLIAIDETLNEMKNSKDRVCHAVEEIVEDTQEVTNGVKEMMGDENAANTSRAKS